MSAEGDDEARHLDGVARLVGSLARAGLVVDDELRLDSVGPYATARVSRVAFVVDGEPPVVGFATVSTGGRGEPTLTTTSLAVSYAGRWSEARVVLDPPTVGGARVTIPASGPGRASYEGATNPEVVRCRGLYDSLDPAALAVLDSVVAELDRRGLDSVSAVLAALEGGEDSSSDPGVASRSEVLAATTLLEGAAAGAPVEWVLRRVLVATPDQR